jgi:hypothetical protein
MGGVSLVSRSRSLRFSPHAPHGLIWRFRRFCLIDLDDILATLDGFSGLPYPDADPCLP